MNNLNFSLHFGSPNHELSLSSFFRPNLLIFLSKWCFSSYSHCNKQFSFLGGLRSVSVFSFWDGPKKRQELHSHPQLINMNHTRYNAWGVWVKMLFPVACDLCRVILWFCYNLWFWVFEHFPYWTTPSSRFLKKFIIT
jgi:hypothetical protein